MTQKRLMGPLRPAWFVVLTLLLSCKTQSDMPYYLVSVSNHEDVATVAEIFGVNAQTIYRDNRISPESLLKNTRVRVYVSKKVLSQRGDALPYVSSLEEVLDAPQPPKLTFGVLNWPLRAKLSSGFGKRGRKLHQGIDLPAPKGTPIRAAADGLVKFAGWKKGYGHVVEVAHPRFEITSIYAHCHSLLASPKQLVKMGQQIATVGRTGRATGNHLHFELRDANYKAFDPLPYLQGSERFAWRP